MDKAIDELEKAQMKCHLAPIGAQTIAKILAAEPPLPRLSLRGVRYADSAGLAREKIAPVRDVKEMLAALRTDLQILQEVLTQVIAGLRDALPLVEKGEFAAVMLSGRNAFADKMPQFVQMFAAFESYYIRTLGVTVTATMQLYPKGYEWLTKPAVPKEKQ